MYQISEYHNSNKTIQDEYLTYQPEASCTFTAVMENGSASPRTKVMNNSFNVMYVSYKSVDT
jgi:hypothetical protein